MSVADGQPVNATVTNAAFMSRTTDTSTTGAVEIQNATPSGSVTTGALVVDGGVGIGGDLNVDGMIGSNGDISTAASIGAEYLDIYGPTTSNINADLNIDGALSVTGAVSGSNLSGTNTGDVTLATIGATPNAQGASLTGQALTLQPASSSFGGVVTTGAQGIAGIKTLEDALGMKEITTPATPASGYQRLFIDSVDGEAKRIDDTGTVYPLGGGGGGAGLNFLEGDSFDFEATVGDWLAYADAAGVEPVDGTGGSPTVTMTRTATSPLNGTGSGLLTKDAANRQGEGVSVAFDLPSGYQNQRRKLTFAHKVASGTYTAGALRVFVYDVTNAKLLNTLQSEVLAGDGVFATHVDFESGVSHRLIIHVSGTDANAYTFKFDDVVIGGDVAAVAANVGPVTYGTLAIKGVTSDPTVGSGVDYQTASWWRVGGSLHLRFDFKRTGNTGAAAGSGKYYFELPEALTADTSAINNDDGEGAGVVGSAAVTSAGNLYSGVVRIPANDTRLYVQVGNNNDSPNDIGSGFLPLTASNYWISFQAVIPIEGWDYNVQIGTVGTYRMSNILANGTRVTGTDPVRLGEYRTYRKASSTVVPADETSAAPNDAPSSANGIRIYESVAYASADASGEPSRYVIFVGKNKVVRSEWYGTTGRTGLVEPTPSMLTFGVSQTDYGWYEFYTPSTGLYEIRRSDNAGSGSAGHASGVVGGGDPYFDLVVSDAANVLGVEVPKDTVCVHSGNGHGSTANKIRRFTNIGEQIGGAITYADSSTDGASFTINQTGVYSITYADNSGGVNPTIGITRNATALSTGIGSTAPPIKLVSCTIVAGNYAALSVSLPLNRGDVIRAHTDGNPNGTDDAVMFRITRVA